MLDANGVRMYAGTTRALNMNGLQKADIKAAVLQQLCIGNKYTLKSGKTDELEIMKLVDLSTHTAVFETMHGLKESFTYSSLYQQLICGE